MGQPHEAEILSFDPTGGGDRQSQDLREQLRMVEAIVFASSEPVSEKALLERLPEDIELEPLMRELQQAYSGRGVNLVKLGDHWAFRTADDLGFLLQKEAVDTRKLSRAALEVLAIIAYHQPVTRAEIEEIRGVSTSKGTLDVLLETQWVRMRGRRKTPGRPVTYGTTLAFLDQFGLEELRDLPGLEELKGAGLLRSQVPANFVVPEPNDSEELAEDEDPLEPQDLEELGLLSPLDLDE
ncbi:MAG: SMC-Scp complex subunit ScpB [Rhizobiaceae bacterium]|jgi:segregation and condensation protein B|nr:SMC-Scp complex subunit ScpB [Rhizobiaceae bacterium]